MDTKIRVFIADDHTVVRDGLRALMEDYPQISVVGDTSDGNQAVSQVLSLRPDVVLMDISMPVLNGIEATRQILELLPETRVIILSILGTAEHVSRALEAGVRGYLLKESAGREVVDAVISVYAGNIYLSQPITATVVSDYVTLHEKASPKNPLEALSQREMEIFNLVVDGKSSSEIAKSLHLSQKTVESYRSRMMQKLGVADITELVKFAMHAGLIS